MNLAIETHTRMQVTIERQVTDDVRWYDCDYDTRDIKNPEDALSLQIHLGSLKRKTVGLNYGETLVLRELKSMREHTSDTWSKRLMNRFMGSGFKTFSDVEQALHKFVEKRS